MSGLKGCGFFGPILGQMNDIQLAKVAGSLVNLLSASGVGLGRVFSQAKDGCQTTSLTTSYIIPTLFHGTVP